MSALIKSACILLGSLSLAACNSNDSTMSTSGTTPSSIKDQVASDDGASLSTSMSILTRNTNAGIVAGSDRQDVSLTTSKNDDGDIIVNLTALGRKVTFEPSDLNDDGSEFSKTLADGTAVYLWTYDGSWEEVQEGDGKFKYMVRFGTSDVVDGVNTRGYGVMGTRTTVAQLPTSGTATYSAEGGMRADFYPGNDPSAKSEMTADVELDVDFAKAEISGEFNNVTFGDGSTDTVVFKLEPTTVDNGSFSTSMTIETPQNGETFIASSVNGAFFGNEAQEVGGDLSFTARGDGGDIEVEGAGVFGASKE